MPRSPRRSLPPALSCRQTQGNQFTLPNLVLTWPLAELENVADGLERHSDRVTQAMPSATCWLSGNPSSGRGLRVQPRLHALVGKQGLALAWELFQLAGSSQVDKPGWC